MLVHKVSFLGTLNYIDSYNKNNYPLKIIPETLIKLQSLLSSKEQGFCSAWRYGFMPNTPFSLLYGLGGIIFGNFHCEIGV